VSWRSAHRARCRACACIRDGTGVQLADTVVLRKTVWGEKPMLVPMETPLRIPVTELEPPKCRKPRGKACRRRAAAVQVEATGDLCHILAATQSAERSAMNLWLAHGIHSGGCRYRAMIWAAHNWPKPRWSTVEAVSKSATSFAFGSDLANWRMPFAYGGLWAGATAAKAL